MFKIYWYSLRPYIKMSCTASNENDSLTAKNEKKTLMGQHAIKINEKISSAVIFFKLLISASEIQRF